MIRTLAPTIGGFLLHSYGFKSIGIFSSIRVLPLKSLASNPPYPLKRNLKRLGAGVVLFLFLNPVGVLNHAGNMPWGYLKSIHA